MVTVPVVIDAARTVRAEARQRSVQAHSELQKPFFLILLLANHNLSVSCVSKARDIRHSVLLTAPQRLVKCYVL